MTLSISLSPLEESKLRARANAEGTTLEDVIRQAIEPILAAMPDQIVASNHPKKSSAGLLAHLGSAPSSEDIDEVRREMLASFPRDDF